MLLWYSKLQSATTEYNCEGELTILSFCESEIKWVRLVLEYIGIFRFHSNEIYHYNPQEIDWSETAKGLRRVNHMGIMYNFVQDAVEARYVNFQITASSNNLKIRLTKAVVGSTFDQQRTWFGVVKLEEENRTRGGVLHVSRIMPC